MRRTATGTYSATPRARRRSAASYKKDVAQRQEELVQQHLPLVKKVAQRLALRKPPQVEMDELLSWGIEGLLDAIRKYDPRKKAAFTTYAQFRIRGTMLDHLRSMDWVSRSIRQKAHLLERTYRELEGKLGRPATEEEVAAALDLSLAQLHAMLGEVGHMTLFSLEDLGFGTGEERFQSERYLEADQADPLAALITQERVQIVAEAIGHLPEKERIVISLYYHEALTMREVGEVLGLTESRVSQLHSQALLRLKGTLADQLFPQETV